MRELPATLGIFKTPIRSTRQRPSQSWLHGMCWQPMRCCHLSRRAVVPPLTALR